jgi:hypothetical protein
MKAPAPMPSELQERNSITAEPGTRGRFSLGWETTLKEDADWVGFIAGRCLDALDDGIFRDKYLDSSRERTDTRERQRIVVLGSGWGANAILTQLKNAPHCDVTVVSPRNYFLFTPMLAGAALGTLEPR